MAENLSTSLNLVFFLTNLIFFVGISVANLTLPSSTSIQSKILTNPSVIKAASIDYGNIIHEKPLAVLAPTSINDMISLILFANNCTAPFGVSIRGNGHSVSGQDMALKGVVIDMKRYRENGGFVIKVSKKPLFVDVGGEQLWIDVLNVTTRYGFSPVSWTDFLYLSVGGTLSNAGVSGETFRMGPQINNVYELDVITGKGEFLTCSAQLNSDLFYAVLGGLGQFGIIMRARIALGPTYNRVRWARLLFSDFDEFTRTQEYFISRNGRVEANAVSYLEGQIMLDNGTPNTWETSFFPASDQPKIVSLVKQYGIIFVVEVANYYVDTSKRNPERTKLNRLIKGLEAVPLYMYEVDVSYYEFLTRVPNDNVQNPPTSHPWLNLFIPKSKINEFNSGVIRDIVLKNNITTGPVLFYPTNRNKWDDRMSAVIPDEDVIYGISLLHATKPDNYQIYLDQNNAIIQYCANAGIKIKSYLMRFEKRSDWVDHFGSKWPAFERAKNRFDPRFILSPGQKIFTIRK